MIDVGSAIAAVRGLIDIRRLFRWWSERELREIVRAAQRGGGVIVLDKRQPRWQLQAGGKSYPAESLVELKMRGIVRADRLTPIQACDMDYYRLTAIAGGVE